MLKTVLFLCFLALGHALDQAFIDKFMEKLQEIGGICAEETHATSDDIAELISRKLPPSTHEGKCMIFCIQAKFKIMNSDGSLNKSGAIQALEPLQAADPDLYDKLLKIFVSCGMAAKIDADPCETATGLAICAKDKSAEMGIEETIM